MKDRITLLIKAKNLTAAQFADEIGVQKSSISHILSGRNNASLDFIQKILLCYPDVSMDWIMFGKGPIFKPINAVPNPNNDAPSSMVQPSGLPPVDLFSELNPGKPIEYRKEIDLSDVKHPEQENVTDEARNEKTPAIQFIENAGVSLMEPEKNTEVRQLQSEQKNNAAKTISKIVEFYSDNTFREFFPE